MKFPGNFFRVMIESQTFPYRVESSLGLFAIEFIESSQNRRKFDSNFESSRLESITTIFNVSVKVP